MTRWCPRCDAVRDEQATCPSCGTPLADLSAGRPRPAEAAVPPMPAEALPPADPAPSRLRAALALAVVVLAGLAFVAGRAGGPDQQAGSSATPTSVTSGDRPKAPTGRRDLGWSARRGGATVTAVAVERVGDEGRSALDLRVVGLPRGQEVLGLTGLTLRDDEDGLFASPDEGRMGLTPAVPVMRRPDGSYQVDLGPTPDLEALARVEVGKLVVGKTSGANVTLATPRPWPSGARRRAIDPGTRAGMRVVANGTGQVTLALEVTGGFVGSGRADVVVMVKPASLNQQLRDLVPVTAQLRAGKRVLCARTKLIGGTAPYPALVVGCPTGEVDQLTVTLGAGSATVPLDARLRKSG
ncbi:MAG TPA: hypothetical protein VF486_22335 [Actinomycetes bacterium]